LYCFNIYLVLWEKPQTEKSVFWLIFEWGGGGGHPEYEAGMLSTNEHSQQREGGTPRSSKAEMRDPRPFRQPLRTGKDLQLQSNRNVGDPKIVLDVTRFSIQWVSLVLLPGGVPKLRMRAATLALPRTCTQV
jgi:hypothetical protein